MNEKGKGFVIIEFLCTQAKLEAMSSAELLAFAGTFTEAKNNGTALFRIVEILAARQK